MEYFEGLHHFDTKVVCILYTYPYTPDSISCFHGIIYLFCQFKADIRIEHEKIHRMVYTVV